ncbi:hypothetical protein [Prescottella equi]|uniref:hypothetical protein n=1 Tax=Rhodococcus hoagii TaxID=43767 RepID=UPI001EDCC6A6|nr:hypothetical protein [Prescottella equi]
MPKKIVELHAVHVRSTFGRSWAVAPAWVPGRLACRSCGTVPTSARSAGITASPIAGGHDSPDARHTGIISAAITAEPAPIDMA